MNYGVRASPLRTSDNRMLEREHKITVCKGIKSLKTRHAKSPVRFEKDTNKLLEMKNMRIDIKNNNR